MKLTQLTKKSGKLKFYKAASQRPGKELQSESRQTISLQQQLYLKDKFTLTTTEREHNCPIFQVPVERNNSPI